MYGGGRTVRSSSSVHQVRGPAPQGVPGGKSPAVQCLEGDARQRMGGPPVSQGRPSRLRPRPCRAGYPAAPALPVSTRRRSGDDRGRGARDRRVSGARPASGGCGGCGRPGRAAPAGRGSGAARRVPRTPATASRRCWRGGPPPSAGAGPPAVPPAASRPPGPAWRSSRRSQPSGPPKASSAAGSPGRTTPPA